MPIPVAAAPRAPNVNESPTMNDDIPRTEPDEDSGPDTAELEAWLLQLSAGGQEIPSERQLVSDWQVPRSRLRRALARLRDGGLLPPSQVGRRATNSTGARIEDLARVANPTDVIELRILIEPQLARLASIRASVNDVRQIIRAAATHPREGYGAADLNFHRQVARASRNALASELYELLRQVGTDSRVRLPQTGPACPKRRATRDKEHMAIAQAIAARDPERAAHAMQSHLTQVQRLIMVRLSPTPLIHSSSSGDWAADDSTEANSTADT
jgi:DNA-binding FadR family transcriptional regulator